MNSIPNAQIHHFTWKGVFWLQISEQLITGGSVLLPPDVHLTFSYNQNNDIANLHLSRNINAPEKPAIRILEIKKSDLEKYLPLYAQRLLARHIQEVEYKTLNLRNFLSLSVASIESNQAVFEDIFRPKLIVRSTSRKNRIEYSGDLESEFEKLATYNLDEIIGEGPEYPIRIQQGIRIGRQILLDHNCKLFGFTDDNGRVFKVSSCMNLTKALLLFANKSTIRAIQSKTIEAISVICSLNSRDEAMRFSNPIRMTVLTNQKS